MAMNPTRPTPAPVLCHFRRANTQQRQAAPFYILTLPRFTHETFITQE